MNAIDLLKQDHRTVEALFKQVEDTTPGKHPALFKKIKGELDTHAHIEEKILYPALKKKGKKDLVDLVLEGIEEHLQIKMFLKGLAAISGKSERFEPKLKVLIEDTRHHVKEEEREMFPMTQSQLSAEMLEKLGERMEAEKVRYQKANGIKPVKPVLGTIEKFVKSASRMMDEAFGGGNGTVIPRPTSKARGSSPRKPKAA